jgi:hypothetical protein
VGEEARVTIRRTSTEDSRTRQVYVSLDDEGIGVLAYGDEVTRSVRPGRHELRVHNTLTRKRAEFDAAPGEHVVFQATNVASRGFLALVALLGAPLLWTRLRREG